MKNEPILLWSAILVGLQVLFAGAALVDVAGPKIPALGALAVAAAQAGTTFYVRGRVTPTDPEEPADPTDLDDPTW